jgi:colanic acid/amylovoran biosynthesis glycosyltransferase
MPKQKEKKPLRLLVVGSSWPPQTFLGRLMRGLAGMGVHVRIAFSKWPDQDWFLKSGLQTFKTRAWEGPWILRLLWVGWLSALAMFRSPRALRLFWRVAKEQSTLRARLRTLNRLLPFAGVSCDVIYFPWNSAAIDFLPLFELGKPVLVSCRGSQVNVAPHHPLREIRAGLPVTFARASVIHCISSSIQREASRFGLDIAKSRVIRPGVDPEFFSPAPIHQSSPHIRIVTVGSLVWVKGVTYGIQAIRRVVDAGVPVMFTIVGDGPERQRVLYAIDDMGLHEHVRLLGRLSPVAVRDELRHSDIFILPSLAEGFCNAAIEAMGCALPVVMTNCGGALEGVTDGIEGFIVPIWDPDAMAERILRLARDPRLRQTMGHAARARVIRDFNVKRHVGEFAHLLEEIPCGAA